MRERRKTVDLMAVRNARRDGWELAMKTTRVTLMEAAEFKAAELVRKIGWD